MSNAELIRSQYGREGERRSWTAAEVSGGIERFGAPDLVYEEDPNWPGAGIHRGREAVIERFREYQELLGSTETVVESIDDRGDRILMTIRIEGKSVGAAVPFEQRWHYLYDFNEEGRVSRWRAFLDGDDARRVAATG